MSDYKIITCEINKNATGQRLDQVLTKHISNLSRSQIKILLTNGNIKKSNKQFYDASYKVKIGEVYKVKVPLKDKDSRFQSQNIPIDIVFEDHDIIVLNKQAGMVVHPAPGNYDNTLVNALLHHTKNKLSKYGETNRPGIVHRIDKETSGLLVIAKNNFSHEKLSVQFTNHSIKRKYKALVWGLPTKMNIKGLIGRHKINRKKMAIVSKNGKFSETNILLLKKFKTCSLIECELKTGRTHQIRVHLEYINNNIVGDKVYGKKKINKKNDSKLIEKLLLSNFNRQALHAYFLGFNHPRSNKYIEFTSVFPPDFDELLKHLSKY